MVCKQPGLVLDHVRCYIPEEYPARDNKEIKLDYSLLQTNPRTSNGIYKSISSFVETFGSIQDYLSQDNLHEFYHGIEKRYFSYHLDSKYHKKTWYITPECQAQIDHLIAQIRLQKNYHQIPSLKKIKHWKAEEVRNFMHFAARKIYFNVILYFLI
jgi:hypothetical protein